MGNVRAFFFDLGGTLVDVDNFFVSAPTAVAQVLKSKGIEPLDDFVDRFWEYWSVPGIPRHVETTCLARTQAMLRKLGAAPKYSLVEEISRRLNELHVKGLVVEEDALETLSYLRERGYLIGILSNTGFHNAVVSVLEKAKLTSVIDVLVTSEQVGVRKPHRAIFDLACWLAGAEPPSCAYVGNDPTTDIWGAKNAGWRTVQRLQSRLKRSPYADFTIKKISELKKLHNQIFQ